MLYVDHCHNSHPRAPTIQIRPQHNQHCRPQVPPLPSLPVTWPCPATKRYLYVLPLHHCPVSSVRNLEARSALDQEHVYLKLPEVGTESEDKEEQDNKSKSIRRKASRFCSKLPFFHLGLRVNLTRSYRGEWATVKITNDPHGFYHDQIPLRSIDIAELPREP